MVEKGTMHESGAEMIEDRSSVESAAILGSRSLEPMADIDESEIVGAAHVRFWNGELALIFYRVLVVVAFLGAWQLASGHLFTTLAISRPTAVALALYHYVGSRAGWIDIRITMTEYVLGFFFGAFSGLAAALFFASVKTAGRVFEPIMAACNAIPIIALAPLFIIIFGLGIWSKVVVASFAVFFLMFWNVYIGAKNLPVCLLNMIRVIGGSRWDRIRYGLIPGIAPSILAAVRLGLSTAMLGAVIGEFIVSVGGIGHFIANAGEGFQTANVLAAIIVVVTITLTCRGLVILLERRLLRWQRGSVI
jgi:NitT/TauT family transport system permease protein